MERYSQAASNIIMAQKMVMGPLAFELAKSVDGLVVSNSDVSINKDPKEVLTNLVTQYKMLFGEASLMVSRDAIKGMRSSFNNEELPRELSY